MSLHSLGGDTVDFDQRHGLILIDRNVHRPMSLHSLGGDTVDFEHTLADGELAR